MKRRLEREVSLRKLFEPDKFVGRPMLSRWCARKGPGGGALSRTRARERHGARGVAAGSPLRCLLFGGKRAARRAALNSGHASPPSSRSIPRRDDGVWYAVWGHEVIVGARRVVIHYIESGETEEMSYRAFCKASEAARARKREFPCSLRALVLSLVLSSSRYCLRRSELCFHSTSRRTTHHTTDLEDAAGGDT